MKHDFKGAWNEVSGWHRKRRIAVDQRYSLGLGYDICIKSRIANNVILELRPKPGGESSQSDSLHFPADPD